MVDNRSAFREIGVVTSGRSDYSISLPLLRCIDRSLKLNLKLLVTGMHLSPHFGQTVRSIESDGFKIADRIEMLLSSDTPESIAKSMGLGTVGFAQAYARSTPDILVVLGDRFEMHAAVIAALPFRIPIAHIHGGELTEGAFDDSLRHSITKLSHLHFVATQEYGERVVQMGEEPWRVTISGAPSLDNLNGISMTAAEDLEKAYGVTLNPAPLLVTFHPVTLEFEKTGWYIDELLEALDRVGFPIVFTKPNADTTGLLISEKITTFVNSHPSSWLFDNLGTVDYFSMMGIAAAMVGNSSSGIIEAPSLGLPVVNIGTRQQGRVKAANVIDVGYTREEIMNGIKVATSVNFKRDLAGQANPYGDGRASEKIVQVLEETNLDQRLIMKRFSKPDSLNI